MLALDSLGQIIKWVIEEPLERLAGVLLMTFGIITGVRSNVQCWLKASLTIVPFG